MKAVLISAFAITGLFAGCNEAAQTNTSTARYRPFRTEFDSVSDVVREMLVAGEVYTDKKYLPAAIVDYISEQKGKPFRIANPDEPYSTGCVAITSHVYGPDSTLIFTTEQYRSKLHFLVADGNRWVMSWSHGGFVFTTGFTLFELDSQRVVKTVVVKSSGKELTTTGDLRRALDSSSGLFIHPEMTY